MKSLFLIPARGGSKGIPAKNIKYLSGKPLICYSIDCARMLSSDDNICVSTDEDAIIQVVEDYGLAVPFKRPPELATDTSGTYEVILHAVDYYEKKGRVFDIVVLLQPTSPFRKSNQVADAISKYESKIDMVVSVKETRANPYYLLVEESEQGFLEKSKKGNFTRRQDCPIVWELNGAIYVFNVQSLKQKPISEFHRAVKYVMDELTSVDIDNQVDWMFSEFLIEKGLVTANGK